MVTTTNETGPAQAADICCPISHDFSKSASVVAP